MITMLLGGLWHGATWTFVVWGGIHGLWINAEHILERAGFSISPKRFAWPARIVGMVLTFHLVCVTWIFFRAESLADAFDILFGMFRPASGASLEMGFFMWLPALLLVEALMWRTSISGVGAAPSDRVLGLDVRRVAHCPAAGRFPGERLCLLPVLGSATTAPFRFSLFRD